MTSTTPAFLGAVALATLVAVPPTPAAQSGRPACPADAGTQHISVRSDTDDRSWQVKWSTGSCSVDLRTRGTVTFARDLGDVESIERGGWFVLTERVGRVERSLEIKAGRDGGLERTYTVDGDRRGYDGEAHRWLAAVLIDVERRTAFSASTRVPQLFREGGARAVLEEIGNLRADHARRVYYRELLALDDQVDAETRRAIVRQAGRELSSDHEKAELLIAIARYAVDETTRPAYFDAAGSIGSDHEHRRVLGALLESGGRNRETVYAILESAKRIDSDHELAELLVAVSAKLPIDDELRPVYMRAADTIGSDHEFRRVLSALRKNGGL